MRSIFDTSLFSPLSFKHMEYPRIFILSRDLPLAFHLPFFIFILGSAAWGSSSGLEIHG